MKKGISEVISWVLLVGLTVVLGIMVSIWIRSTAEETVEKQIEQVDQKCDDIGFNVKNNSECAAGSIPFTIANRGSFTVHDFVIRINGEVWRNGLNTPVKLNILPGQAKDLNIDVTAGSEIEFIPVVDENACSSRRLRLKC